MVDRMQGRVAVVTGAASGIGAAVARRYVAEGGRCVVADLQDDAGRAVAADLGEAGAFRHCDVTVEDDVAAAVAFAVEHFGRLDTMVNNAGILGAVGSIVDIDAGAWGYTIGVMLTGVFHGIKHGARQMMAQGDGGAIVNMASSAGVRAGLGPHVYTAAKHGVVGLTGSVAVELGRHGIRVNAVAPGGTTTPLTARLVVGDHRSLDAARAVIGRDGPLGRGGEPNDIADAVIFLASEEARFVSGSTLVVDGAGDVPADKNQIFVDLGPQLWREAGGSGL